MPLRHLMYGLALRMGIPSDDAADAVQETQIRLWRRRDAIPINSDELKLYCMASMRNECLTRIRLRKDVRPLEEAGAGDIDYTENIEAVDIRRHLELMMERLPAAQRKAIRLSAFAEYETSEIAREMGQTEMNVRQLLSRGRKKLREMMDKLEKTK